MLPSLSVPLVGSGRHSLTYRWKGNVCTLTAETPQPEDPRRAHTVTARSQLMLLVQTGLSASVSSAVNWA